MFWERKAQGHEMTGWLLFWVYILYETLFFTIVPQRNLEVITPPSPTAALCRGSEFTLAASTAKAGSSPGWVAAQLLLRAAQLPPGLVSASAVIADMKNISTGAIWFVALLLTLFSVSYAKTQIWAITRKLLNYYFYFFSFHSTVPQWPLPLKSTTAWLCNNKFSSKSFQSFHNLVGHTN